MRPRRLSRREAMIGNILAKSQPTVVPANTGTLPAKGRHSRLEGNGMDMALSSGTPGFPI